MLREILPEITGFSPEVFTLLEAMNEFNAKFSGTYLKLNDKITFIRDAGYDENSSRYYLRTTRPRSSVVYEQDVKDLTAFRPKVGCYFTSNGNYIIIFNKTARRMYKKSLSPGENYTLQAYSINNKKFLGDYNTEVLVNDLTDSRHIPSVGYISKNRQFAFVDGDILLLGNKIGTYKLPTGSLITFKTLPVFDQEIRDIIKYELEG